jgi:ribosomal protein L35
MPKQKTNRSALNRRHLLAGRSTKRKRQLRKPGLVCAAERKIYLRLLGEG